MTQRYTEPGWYVVMTMLGVESYSHSLKYMNEGRLSNFYRYATFRNCIRPATEEEISLATSAGETGEILTAELGKPESEE